VRGFSYSLTGEAAIRLSFKSRFQRTFVGIAGVVLTVGVLLWALFVALRPLPGRDIAIATGPPGSSYAQVAERYREILARDGVRLRLVPTKGAVENLERLRDSRSGVDAGFVQAGTTTRQESPDLLSLGTVFYEPLWVFCRDGMLIEMLRDLPNATISIGEQGSATRPLALQLLSLNNIDTRVQLRNYPPEEAARQLIAGTIDVAMILAAWDSTAVQMLLHAPGIEPMRFKRADAYVARDPKLSKLVLPQGAADLAMNLPSSDIPLIASKASLAVRRDLHTALQFLLVRAAIEVHTAPGIFQRADEFPAPEAIDLPISTEAIHVYKAGPSILQRTLPFWLAELLERVLVVLLPIVGILYPLWSLLPRFYRWQMQRRIFRLYGELRLIERTLLQSKDPGERAQMLARFRELERQVLDLKVPQSFGEMSFNLKMHIRALSESAHKQA
jgi:TRAP-type uncharacterized transport system substrate-binding protein